MSSPMHVWLVLIRTRLFIDAKMLPIHNMQKNLSHMACVYGPLVSVSGITSLLSLSLLTYVHIAMTPFVQNLSDKLGIQGHRRALRTDEMLRVKGVSDGSIYALGDCATMENPKLLKHVKEILEAADK